MYASLRMRQRLDAEEINRGIGMLEAGLSQLHVAGVLRVSKSTVARMRERFRTHGNVRRRHGGGRERLTTRREDPFIVVQAQRQRFVTVTVKQNDSQNVTGETISTQRIRNLLHRASMKAR